MYQLLAKYAAVQPMAVYSQSCGFLQKEYIVYFPGMKAVNLPGHVPTVLLRGVTGPSLECTAEGTGI